MVTLEELEQKIEKIIYYEKEQYEFQKSMNKKVLISIIIFNIAMYFLLLAEILN